MSMKGKPRARIKAKDDAEFKRWERLVEKLRRRQRGATPKDDESSLRLADNARLKPKVDREEGNPNLVKSQGVTLDRLKFVRSVEALP